MTKFNTFSLLLFAVIAMPLLSLAQPKMGAWPYPSDTTAHNYYINYVGGRIIVNSPAAIQGPLTHTIANDGVLTGGWGGSIKNLPNPINDVEVVKAAPYDACGALTNASAINGKIALIKRGDCEFGTKALNAQNAGAVAVIIVNNIPGPPVGMGAGDNGASVNIPVIMISDVDGAAIDAQLGNSVKISMSTWGNGYNEDLGFVDRGLGTWHAFSIPLEQLKGSTAVPYKGFNTAVIANYGSTTAATVKLKTTLSWTPTGGSTSVVRMDSITFTNFAAIDSIATPFIDNLYDLTATTTGRYDMDYEIIPDFVDQSPGDNKARHTFYVDNSIYSKSRYDLSNGRPFSGAGYRMGDGAAFTWGNFLYFDKGGYQVENVQVSLSKEGSNTNNSMVGIDPVQIIVFKWVDGNSDSVISGPELVPVGFGEHKFVAGDTSGQVHAIQIANITSNGVCTTDANSWYWIAAAMPANAFLQVDGVTNYFPRAWGRSHATAESREPYAPLFPEIFSNLASATNPLQHFPFESYFFLEDSIRFSQQRKGLVPSLPVKMSLFKVGVETVNEVSGIDVSLYPNPATSVLNVSLDLEKEAKEVYYTLMSITGARVSTEKRTNVKNDTYTIQTDQLPAGSYMLFMNVDGESLVRQFSVVK